MKVLFIFCYSKEWLHTMHFVGIVACLMFKQKKKLVSLCYRAVLRRRLGLRRPCVGCGVCTYRACSGCGSEQPLNEALGATLCFYCGGCLDNLPRTFGILFGRAQNRVSQVLIRCCPHQMSLLLHRSAGCCVPWSNRSPSVF